MEPRLNRRMDLLAARNNTRRTHYIPTHVYILTKARKQTLSVQAPQQPRKLMVTITPPMTMRMREMSSSTSSGSVGLSRSSTPYKNVSRYTWIHTPTPNTAHPVTCASTACMTTIRYTVELRTQNLFRTAHV